MDAGTKPSTAQCWRFHQRVAGIDIRALLAKYRILAQRPALGAKQAEGNKAIRGTAKILLPCRMAFYYQAGFHVVRRRQAYCGRDIFLTFCESTLNLFGFSIKIVN